MPGCVFAIDQAAHLGLDMRNKRVMVQFNFNNCPSSVLEINQCQIGMRRALL
jgi:hypothetical protein